MDYFQSVVTEYLRANRFTFVNTECCIQLSPGNPDKSGPHWYCDALTVNLHRRKAYLCEISYSKTLDGLFKRLERWGSQWDLVRIALARDSGVPVDWDVRPWAFVPAELTALFASFMASQAALSMPTPRVSALEDVMPWKYRSWDRVDELDDHPSVPMDAGSV